MALSRRLLALGVWCSVSLLAVVWSTVNGAPRGNSPAMALRHSARLKKGHRPFRESWKRGLRRPRDALPDGPRQSQLNLAWARAKSQKKKPPTKHSKETLAILEDILRDPVLSVELEHYAGYKTPHKVPEDARAAVERSVSQLLGEDALQSISAAPTAHRQSPQLAVYVDRSLSQYDRNDLAVALEALGFATRATRHGVRLAAQGEPEVEVLVGLAQELLSHKRGGFCPFPVSHLTVAEDWREADQRGQEEVQGGEIRWALDLTQHLATTSGLPSLALRGKSQKGDIVLELVLRHLALRIQDRDAQALARFKAALAGQGGEIMYDFWEALIGRISTTAGGLVKSQWAGVKNFQNQLFTLVSLLVFAYSLHLVKKHFLNFSWRKMLLITGIILNLFDATLALCTTYDVVRNQYFYLGETILDEIPAAANFVVGTFIIVEMADQGNEGLTYGLFTTVSNLGFPFSRAIGNQIFGLFQPNLSDRENYKLDTMEFRHTVARSFLLSYAFSFASFLLLVLLPYQKQEAQRRKREWSRRPAFGYITCGLLLLAFIYSMTVNFLTMIPETACLKLIGGSGC